MSPKTIYSGQVEGPQKLEGEQALLCVSTPPSQLKIIESVDSGNNQLIRPDISLSNVFLKQNVGRFDDVHQSY